MNNQSDSEINHTTIEQLQAEVVYLRTRVQQQEMLLADLAISGIKESIFTAILEHAAITIQIYDDQGHLIYINQSQQQLFEVYHSIQIKPPFNILTNPEMIRLGISGFFAQAKAGLVVKVPSNALQSKILNRLDSRTLVHMLFPVRNNQHQIIAIGSCIIDPNEQAQINTFLQRLIIEQDQQITTQFSDFEQGRNLFYAIINNIPGLVFIKDTSGCLLVVNQRYAALSNRTPAEMVGKRESLFFPAEKANAWQAIDDQIALTGEPYQREEQVFLVDGSQAYYLTTKFPIFGSDGKVEMVGGILIDITMHHQTQQERQEFEDRLRESQRLESLGVLAGGIAHDFNNILTSLMGYADLALYDLPAEAPVANIIKELSAGIRRAAELTGQMLAYSGKGKFVISIVQLNELIQEMANFVRISIPKSIQIRYQYANTPTIAADATQIRQVVMNLIMNAAEASIEQSKQPRYIVVSTGTTTPADPVFQHAMVRSEQSYASYATFTVQDYGVGMDAYVLKRMFDPFFTTKFTGRGLGMSVVHGIVRGHHGAISIDSVAGQGTKITVFLPATDQVPQPHQVQELPHVKPATIAKTILVVDDEEQVLDIARRMLERLGYTVLTSANPHQAIELYQRNLSRIDCVLLDLTMPDLDGIALFQQLYILNPDIRAILCSGYSEYQTSERFTQLHLAGFLAKPYRMEQLRQALEQALQV